MSRKKKEQHEEAQAAAAAEAGEQPKLPTESESLRAERDDLLARLQRVSADYINYQKRVQKDIAQAREFANEELLRALLPVLDDMQRALATARENHDENDPLLQGMQLVHDMMLETLGRFGLSVIDAEGRKFDPDLHSAMLQQPSDQHPPMTILQEVRKGYQLKGRTIRPSAVIVAGEPDKPPPGQEGTETESRQPREGQ
jgi:molecular chaperone GrpE